MISVSRNFGGILVEPFNIVNVWCFVKQYKAGALSFNYSQQGINSKNFISSAQTRIPIKTAATYNTVKVKRSDFMNAEKIEYKLKLYKKVDENNEVKYVEVTDVDNNIDRGNDAPTPYL